MIREPYNINPYNSTIDTSKVNNFGFTFSGDELGSWKVEIAKNNTSPDIVYTSKEFVPSDVGYEHIYDSDRVEGITLPSTIAHNQEDDGLLRRLYDIVGYPYNASVVRLAVNDINDLGKIKGCTSDGYLVATTYSLGREDENVTILGYDENGVAVGTQVTNGTYNFLGYLLTVKANSDIAAGQKVQIGDNTFTIGDIEDTQDGYYELMIANGTGSFSGDAEVVTFDTLASANLTELKVKLTPAQDLHGQSSPYPSGGGKNKLGLPYASASPKDSNGILWTANDDGSITISGTATATSIFFLKTYAQQNMTLNSGTYTFSIKNCPSALNFAAQFNDGTDKTMNKANPTVTFTNSATLTDSNHNVYLYINSGSAISGSVTVYPQIEMGNQATDWSPYSNICPIYPSNGKNLVQSVLNGLVSIGASNCVYQTNSSTRSLAFKCEKGQTYTVSGITANRFSWGVFANVPSNNDTSTSYGSSNSTSIPQSFTTSASGICVLYVSNSAIDTSKAQVEQGSTATPYVPYQGINVVHTGKNLLDPSEWESGLLNTSIGSDINSFVSSSRYAHSGICKVGQAKTVTIKTLDPAKINYGAVVAYVDDKVAWTNAVTFTASTTAKTWTLASNTYEKLRINLGAPSGVTADASYVEVQVEQGSTATTYEPYTSTTYPIPLGRDVYGGTLDVVSGKLVVDKVEVDMGELAWAKYADVSPQSVFYVSIADMKKGSAWALSSEYKVRSTWTALGSLEEYTAQTHPSLSVIYVRDDRYADYTSFRNAVSGVQLVYELATPLEYDLTPTQITTLLGTNNMWSSGNILNVTFSYEES